MLNYLIFPYSVISRECSPYRLWMIYLPGWACTSMGTLFLYLWESKEAVCYKEKSFYTLKGQVLDIWSRTSASACFSLINGSLNPWEDIAYLWKCNLSLFLFDLSQVDFILKLKEENSLERDENQFILPQTSCCYL